MTAAGEIALWMAMLFAAWGLVAGAVGGATRRGALVASGARALPAAAAMLALAGAGVVASLVGRDYALAYPAAVSSHDLPARYAVGAAWAGSAGATLLLALLLAAAAAAVTARVRAGRAVVVSLPSAALLALVAPLCAGNLLFARLAWVPPDGVGLAPALETPFFLVHGPLAAAAWAIAGAHAAAAVAARLAASPALARRAVRAGTLAWLLAGVAALVAARWAYRDPAWGGRWFARPLHDGSLVAWLLLGASTAAGGARGGVAARLAAPLAVLAAAAAAMAAAVAPLALVESSGAALRGGRGIAFLALLSVASAAMWRAHPAPGVAASSGRWQLLRRVAAGVAAAGAALVLLAVVGARARVEHDVEIADGRATEVTAPDGTRWRLVGQGVSRFQRENRDVSQLVVELSREGRSEGFLAAERWQAIDVRGELRGDPVSTVGVHAGIRRDVTLALVDAQEGGARARVAFEPWALWVWVGGALLLLGGAAALWR